MEKMLKKFKQRKLSRDFKEGITFSLIATSAGVFFSFIGFFLSSKRSYSELCDILLVFSIIYSAMLCSLYFCIRILKSGYEFSTKNVKQIAFILLNIFLLIPFFVHRTSIAYGIFASTLIVVTAYLFFVRE